MSFEANISVMQPDGQGGLFGGGDVGAKLLANNMDVGCLRPWVGKDGRAYIAVNSSTGLQARPTTNATLRKEEWKELDAAIMRAAQQRMVGVADLYSRNLIFRLQNGLGTTVLEHETMNDTTAAQVTMDAATRGTRDRLQFGMGYLPLPVVHKDFQLDIRTLNASRTRGQALNTLQAEDAARRVMEKVEGILFNGLSSFSYGSDGGTIYGYTDFTNRNQYTIAAHWNDSAATGTTMLADVLGI